MKPIVNIPALFCLLAFSFLQQITPAVAGHGHSSASCALSVNGKCLSSAKNVKKGDDVDALYMAQVKRVLLDKLGLLREPKAIGNGLSERQREHARRSLLDEGERNSQGNTCTTSESSCDDGKPQYANQLTKEIILPKHKRVDLVRGNVRFKFNLPQCPKCLFTKTVIRIQTYSNQSSNNGFYNMTVKIKQPAGHILKRFKLIMPNQVGNHWLSVDLKQIMRRWFGRKRRLSEQLIAEIHCPSCQMKNGTIITTYDASLLVEYRGLTHDAGRVRRQAIDCGRNTRLCCKQTKKIAFRDFGWDWWILAPLEIDIGYCHGKCSFSSYQPANIHSRIMRSLRMWDSTEYGPSCCIPSSFAPIKLIYYDSFVVKQKIIDNLVVGTCGCS